MSSSSPPGLRLDIGELHLHGFGPEHRERFAAALHAALGDMLREGGTGTAPGLPPPPIEHLRHDASDADPEAAARETARAIWARVGRGRDAPARPRGGPR